jgi:hypothetical protein
MAVVNQDASEVLNEVLAIVTNADWRNERDRLKEDLAPFLTDDLFEGDYELVNASTNLRMSKQVPIGPDSVEIILQGASLADKATLVRGPDGGWRLKSFLGQCTGCLGSGKILERTCRSCSGTGWGLRPS